MLYSGRMKPDLERFIDIVENKAQKLIGQKRRVNVISQEVPPATDSAVLQGEGEVSKRLSDEEAVVEINRILNREVPH